MASKELQIVLEILKEDLEKFRSLDLDEETRKAIIKKGGMTECRRMQREQAYLLINMEGRAGAASLDIREEVRLGEEIRRRLAGFSDEARKALNSENMLSSKRLLVSGQMEDEKNNLERLIEKIESFG